MRAPTADIVPVPLCSFNFILNSIPGVQKARIGLDEARFFFYIRRRYTRSSPSDLMKDGLCSGAEFCGSRLGRKFGQSHAAVRENDLAGELISNFLYRSELQS